jgi:hypothetical protein
MKALVAALATLVITMLARPAIAYVVVVTTSVAASNAANETQLQASLDSAIRDVLAHAIAFTPTVVTLEGVRRIGNEIYLVLLIADADGEKSLKAFSTTEPSPESTDPSREDTPGSTL